MYDNLKDLHDILSNYKKMVEQELIRNINHHILYILIYIFIYFFIIFSIMLKYILSIPTENIA